MLDSLAAIEPRRQRYRSGTVIVSHAHRFVFLKTRKTAGTSVEIALSTVCGPDDVITPVTEADERLRREYGGRAPQHYESPPLPRKAFNHMPASMVRQLVGREASDATTPSRSSGTRGTPWSRSTTGGTATEPSPALRGLRAAEAVEELATKNFRGYRINGELAVDRVLRYESLAEDLAEVWAHSGCRASRGCRAPRAAPGPRGPSYALLLRRRVARPRRGAFAAAIDDFGYEF